MPIDFDQLKSAPRILIEAALRPVAGTRIQPTGFPDLGPAYYEVPDGNGGTVSTLLVESAQSMANRLEAVCWDEEKEDLVEDLKGLPYVKVKLAGLGDGNDITYSILEFHRLNSPYIMQKPKDSTRTYTATGQWFREVFRAEIGLTNRVEESDAGEGSEPGEVEGVINLRRLAKACFMYDPNSLIHGVFLEKIAGRLRHPRALSAFIEASGVMRADTGGVKFDRALPAPKVTKLVASEGFGNVPFHRTEFTAKNISAFFSLDLAQIRGYGLGGDAWKLLVVLSLWKVRRFLDSSMRLRTACELDLVEPNIVCRYKNDERKDQQFPLPSAAELKVELRELLGRCNSQFATPPITELTWKGVEKKATKIEIELPSDFPPPAPFAEPITEIIEYKETGKKPKKKKVILKKGLSQEILAEIEKARPDDKQLLHILKSRLEALNRAANEPSEDTDGTEE